MTLICVGVLIGIIFTITSLYLVIELDDLGEEFYCKIIYLLIGVVVFICIFIIIGRSLWWNI